MKSIAMFILIAMFALSGCTGGDSPTSSPQTGDIPIAMNLQPALDCGLRVSLVQVTITRGDFTESMDLEINGAAASGVFEDLDPGMYAIDVNVYDGEILVATGQGTGEVRPGETTQVSITLDLVTGELVVNVEWEDENDAPQRVLFVGNSHTYFNTGVDTHLQQLVDTAHPEWEIVCEDQTFGGYTLEQHYNNNATIEAIQSGDWDTVVLQEQSNRGAYEPDLFYEYTILLDEVIRQSDGKSCVFMVQPWEDDEEMYGLTVANVTYIGAYLDISVAPVGIAYVNALSQNPHLDLYADDGYHPTVVGTYLDACVFYATFWDESPEDIDWRPDDVSLEEAQLLQSIAWQTVQAYSLARTKE